jgi:hypothetical protein
LVFTYPKNHLFGHSMSKAQSVDRFLARFSPYFGTQSPRNRSSYGLVWRMSLNC